MQNLTIDVLIFYHGQYKFVAGFLAGSVTDDAD